MAIALPCIGVPVITSVEPSRDAGDLPVQPHVLETPTVENAVGDNRQPFDSRTPAGCGPCVEDNRTRGVASKGPLNLPNQGSAFFRVSLARLPVDQRVYLLVAEPGIIAIGTAGVVFVKHLGRVINTRLADMDADRVVLPNHLGKPVGGFDRFEHRADVDLFHLIDGDDSRVTLTGSVARRHRDSEPLVWPVAELFHNGARFGPV